MFDLDKMVSLVQLLMLMVCVFGYSSTLHSKFGVKINFSGICSVAFLSLAMLVAGFLNLLVFGAVVLYVVGIFLFIVNLFMGEISFRKYKLYYILTSVTVLVYAVLMFGSEVPTYDAFTHWGLVIRLMQTTNRIPRFDDIVIAFKDYPLGVSLFSYFGSILVRYKENLYMQSYAVIFVMSMGVLLSSSVDRVYVDSTLEGMLKDDDSDKKEKKDSELSKNINKISEAIDHASEKPGIEDRLESETLRKVVSTVLSVIFFIAVVCFSEKFDVRIYKMYVDTILAVVGVSLIFLVYSYRDEMEKIIVPYFLLSCFLINIKHSGVFFVSVATIYAGYHFVRTRNIGAVSIMALIMPFFSKLAWERHCLYVYNTLEHSKHAMSFMKYSQEKSIKGEMNVDNILNTFIGRNLSDRFWYVLVALVVISATWMLIRRKDVAIDFFKTCLMMFVVSFVYQIGNAMMYVYSMPLNEALKLAGYDRYFNTVKLFVILYILAFLYKNIRDIVFPINEALIVLGLFLVVVNMGGYKDVFTPAREFSKSDGMFKFKRSIVENVDGIDYRSPEDTMNKKVLVFDNVGYSYPSYITYRYVLLTPNIEIKKVWDENRTDTSKYDVVLRNVRK